MPVISRGKRSVPVGMGEKMKSLGNISYMVFYFMMPNYI